MNEGQAKRLTIVAVVVSGGLAAVNEIRQLDAQSGGALGPLGAAGPRFVRIGLGMVVAGVGLSLVSEFSPQLGGSLAALLLASSVFVIGAPALTTITKGMDR